MKDKPDGLYVFPYYAGPAIRPFSVGLIWSGRLTVTLPGWPSGKPPKVFYEIGQHANKISHPLENLFGTTLYYYNLASKQCVNELEKLSPLEDRLNRVFVVGPGGRQPYDNWLPLHDKCLPIVSKTLQNQQILNCACTEFIWRVYELFLELNENPDNVLNYLNVRSNTLGNPDYLLLESSLHHYSIGKANVPEIITDSIDVLAVFNEIGSSLGENSDNVEVKVAQIAYFLFETLLEKYVPKLHLDNIDKLLSILNNKNDSIKAARTKCFSEAQKLIVKDLKASNKEIVTETINNLKSEISEIATLDSRAWTDLLQSLSEDRVFWTSIAGFIGALAGSMPSIVPAAAAITALSSIGTTALRERRLSRERLNNSPWSLVYYLRNKN